MLGEPLVLAERAAAHPDDQLHGRPAVGAHQHREPRWPGSYQEGSSRAARSSRAPTVSQVILGLSTGSAARQAIGAAVGRQPGRGDGDRVPASVCENWTTVPPAAVPPCTPGASAQPAQALRPGRSATGAPRSAPAMPVKYTASPSAPLTSRTWSPSGRHRGAVDDEAPGAVPVGRAHQAAGRGPQRRAVGELAPRRGRAPRAARSSRRWPGRRRGSAPSAGRGSAPTAAARARPSPRRSGTRTPSRSQLTSVLVPSSRRTCSGDLGVGGPGGRVADRARRLAAGWPGRRSTTAGPARCRPGRPAAAGRPVPTRSPGSGTLTRPRRARPGRRLTSACSGAASTWLTARRRAVEPRAARRR